MILEFSKEAESDLAHKIAVEEGRVDVADALEAILEDLSKGKAVSLAKQFH